MPSARPMRWPDSERCERLRARRGGDPFSTRPSLFTRGQIPLDVALLQLSPPDTHGYCTLGTSVDAALAASQSATSVVAEISDRMPRTHGNTLVPFSSNDRFVQTSRPVRPHERHVPHPRQ